LTINETKKIRKENKQRAKYMFDLFYFKLEKTYVCVFY